MQTDLGSEELFRGMSGEEIRQVMKCSGGELYTCEKGSVLFSEGEEPKYIFLLISGRLLMSKHFLSGRRSVICEIHEHELFGLLVDAIGNQTYWYDAIAVAECRVLRIPWEFLFGMCAKACGAHRKFIRNMFQIQADINVYQMQKLNILSAATVEERVGRLILLRMGSGSEVDFKMNREELADYLGVTRPSLSRTLMQMQKKGLIRVERSRVKILDRDALEKHCIR